TPTQATHPAACPPKAPQAPVTPARHAPPKHGEPGTRPPTAKADRFQTSEKGKVTRAKWKTAALPFCTSHFELCTVKGCPVPSDPVELTKQIKAASDIVAVVSSYLA